MDIGKRSHEAATRSGPDRERRMISTDGPGQLGAAPGQPAATGPAGWDLNLSRWPVPDAMIRLYRQAEALRRAFPAWSIAVQPWAGGRARIEAVNPHGGGLYALISTDPAELWRELSATSVHPRR